VGRVQIRHHIVATANGGADAGSVVIAEEPRLPPPCFKMRVASEERVPGRCLVPSNEELRVRIAEKTTGVCTSKRKTGHVVSENHGNGRLEVLPTGVVVSGPNRNVTLTARKEGAGEDERPAAGMRLKMPSVSGHGHVKSIHVVIFSVFHVAMMYVVSRHADFRAVEHARFVHVVPSKQVLRSAGVPDQTVTKTHRGKRLTYTVNCFAQYCRTAGLEKSR
jgi:hypothetical protein